MIELRGLICGFGGASSRIRRSSSKKAKSRRA
jgi:hypothetical protein